MLRVCLALSLVALWTYALSQNAKEVSVEISASEGLTGWIRSNGEVNALGCGGRTICVGDDGLYGVNASYRGFLSFDLSGLPADLAAANILSARLELYQQGITGNPYEDLKTCVSDTCTTLLLEHVNYGPSLEVTDFDTAVLEVVKLFGTAAGNPPLASSSIDVLETVRKDWESRAALGQRTQYRLRFPKATDGDGQTDVAVFKGAAFQPYRPGSETTKLVVVYSLP